MSSDGFHVHGPHDHAIEHVAEHGGEHEGGGNSHAGAIAVVTAIIATIGALFAYQGGATMANAGLYKNNAAIKKTEASNQWNFYQAKSNKQNLSELAVEIAPEAKKEFYTAEIARYKTEKAEIKVEADKLEAESKEWDKKSDEEMHQHHRWAQATTLLQIAIALAAIALLTKRRWLEKGVFVVAGIGVLIGALAAMHY